MRDAFDGILEFWFDRGVAGFRIDVCTHDRQGRRAPRQPACDRRRPSRTSACSVNGRSTTATGPKVHDVIRRWRTHRRSATRRGCCSGRPGRRSSRTLVAFYGDGDDELHLAFNFPFINAPFEAAAMRAVVEPTEALLPGGGWPVWTGSNHDMSRFARGGRRATPTRRGAALFVLLGLRGTPSLYQGDEIGLGDVPRGRGDRSARPAGCRGTGRIRGPRRHAHADAVGHPPGGGFTDPTWNHGCLRGPPGLQRRGPAGRPGVDAHPRP